MNRRVTTFGKQVKLDGHHLADARNELAAKAIADALEFADDSIPYGRGDELRELLA